MFRGFNWLPMALITVLGTAGCDKALPAKESKNPKVKVTHPLTETVMDFQDFTGRLDAVKTVEIRARVSGYVTEVPFKEGDVVKEGDLLFQIDVRPYKADLNQAEANLKVAEAEQNLQVRNAERARVLLPANAISKEDYETVLAAMEKAAANVGAAKAAKERAELYLTYTRVTAPITGRISRRFVDPGNLINADTTVLTTVVTEDPMFAYFDVDERTYLDLLGSVAPGQHSWYEGLKLPVMMRLANEKEFDKMGVVDFVDNRVIANTGTVRMRGVFGNPAGLLKAGLFVRIRLPIGSAYKAIVIPEEAILSDQERKYVWVVNEKNQVEYRSVKLGQSIQDWRVMRAPAKGKEGKEGLSLGERVIIIGMQRVRAGTQVDAEMETLAAPPEMPLVGLWTRNQGNAQ
ncbi:MAG TPA: efflux RND transporter periplasmic adaptor subunit [Gemmataceae bacterium]|jgi:RND family efflux transporter MFP subunit|nr:efflux RND transporter periplasmic adaptor subunit [Gemmataceae bacterium]